MTSGKANTTGELRRRAEEIDRENIRQTAEFMESLSPEAAWDLICELRVSQIELKLQNEELLRLQALQDSRIIERKRAEEDLKKKEELLDRQNRLFATLLDNLPIGVFMVEAPSGKPLLANEAALKLLGRGILPDASRKNISEVYKAYRMGTGEPYPPDEMPIIKGMNGEHSYIDDMEVLRPDGTKTLLEVYGSPVVDGQGNNWASLVTFADITERKTAEKVLQASQKRYQVLLEQSFDALALIDIETLEVVEVNRRFTEMLGYSLPEDAPLYVAEISMDPKEKIFERYKKLNNQRILQVESRKYFPKNGGVVFAERAGAVIEFDGRNYLLATMRDMTEERRRQAELSSDVDFARRVQLELLPKISDSSAVTVRTIYHPSNIVGGDSYFMEWRKKGKVLRGFLIDITGHGVATALQTASINALLRETSIASLTLMEQLRRIDSRAARYFSEGTCASMIGFELDFTAMELRYVGAGITQFYFNGKKTQTPGMVVGIIKGAEFETGAIPIAEGDCVCFLTDGFTDRLSQPAIETLWSPDGKDFEADVAALKQLAEKGNLLDDATALCFRINGKKPDVAV